MSAIRAILREIFGLFVDDGGYATAILLWLGAAGLVASRHVLPPLWAGPLLFAGLATILVASAVRRSRR